MRNVVVVGATGHFGGRICRRLMRRSGIKLYISSRSKSSAESFAAKLSPVSKNTIVEPVQLDQTSSAFASDLRLLNPEVVVHTAGPYQGQDYTVANACLQCNCHYIDLADGREFVEKFSCLNEAALRKDLLLVTGASTLPGLSSAVLATFESEFAAIRSIETTIAPAHQTPRGLGTIAAVLSYCGKPFSVLENGAWRTRYGWHNLKRVHYPELGSRFAGACDVPDLALLPDKYPNLQTATFHAALEAPWEQLCLWCMASLTRMGIITNWSRCTGIFESFSKGLSSLGSDRGGMSMLISGIDKNNKELQINWYLVAENNHGPEIPCTPALVLVRKLLEGDMPIRGAIPCLSLFTLDDFAYELHDLEVSWSHQPN